MIRVPLDGEAAPAQSPPVAPVFELPELMNPLTGEIIDRDSIDELIDALEFLKDKNDRCYAVMCEIRTLLAAKTEGDAKTRRVRGQRRAAKVEMPGLKFEQAKLKEAFNSYPQFRDEVLKIDSIGVKLTEYKKLVNTSGTKAYEQFRDMVTGACKGPEGTPTVTIEV